MDMFYIYNGHMRFLFIFLLIPQLLFAKPQQAAQVPNPAPKYSLVLCSEDTITKMQKAYESKKTSTVPGLDPLLSYAAALINPKNLKFPMLSVTQSSLTPPSGDKHDYASIMIYGWPSDPKNSTKPWVYKDGQVNTARTQFAPDSDYLSKTKNKIQVTATAYAVTSDIKYATKAANLMRSWFIDPATRMNPNLNYAQSLPGVNSGTNYGIIEGIGLIQTLDSEKMLENSGQLSDADKAAFQKWMSDYANWLQTSPFGIKESQTTNNHLSWYDLQLVSIDYFLGRTDEAKKILTDIQQIIETQINPDGSMPQEIKRTRPLHYSLYNLNALTDLAFLGQKVGVDLWNYQTKDGSSIKKAVQYIAPCIQKDGECPFQAESMKTIEGDQPTANGVELLKPQNALQVLNRANSVDPTHTYQSTIDTLGKTVMTWSLDPQIMCEPGAMGI
jgi:hypothetical protein